jgi:protein Mpv17
MFSALVLLLSPAAGFVAGPARLSMVQQPRMASTTGPVMLFGGAGRSFGRIARICKPVMKVPGKPTGGSGFGCGNDDGGSGGDATPAPEPAGDDSGDNPFMAIWKAYNSKLESDPLIMKMLTSFTGFLLGDIIAQTLITKGPFDWFRLFRLSSFGFLIHGSTSHYFYGFLDGKIPGATAPVVALKVFIDQVLWNPIFGVMFFGYVAALERKGVGFVTDKIKNELMTQVTGSWKVWPFAHAINFRFIPSSQRVLYINSIQIGYNCFLSLISNR